MLFLWVRLWMYELLTPPLFLFKYIGLCSVYLLLLSMVLKLVGIVYKFFLLGGFASLVSELTVRFLPLMTLTFALAGLWDLVVDDLFIFFSFNCDLVRAFPPFFYFLDFETERWLLGDMWFIVF